MPPKMTGSRITLDSVAQTVKDAASGIADRKPTRPFDATKTVPDTSTDLPAAGAEAIKARKVPGGYNPIAAADALEK